MIRYHIQIRGLEGDIMEEDARDFSHDLDALDYARSLAGSHSIEVWDGERRVARVKPGDVAATPSDRESN
jgi:hypothetical protein